MKTYTNAEDLVWIEKSNKAMQALYALPASQRTTIIEGFVAAIQLSGTDLTEIKKRTATFSWFEKLAE